ncbi:MAG TPA: lysophospholipid acyltransferase family protein [Gammaproteobacteria bacterium]
MPRALKILFFSLIVRPIVLVVLGLNIRDRHKLPVTGPAIIIANHNSHLDAMVLMSLYPLSMIHKVRPVAAADYFLANRIKAWFSLNVIGIIPLSRQGGVNRDEMFAACHAALDKGDILILFPEGTRGEPEQAVKPKKGLYYLVKDRTDTAIIPVVIHGLGRALPRGEALLVPFNCDVVVGDPLPPVASSDALIAVLTETYARLSQHCLTRTTLK